MDESHRNGEVTEVSDKLEKSLTIDPDGSMEKYHRFIQDGKDVARHGDMHKALEFFKLAYNIHQSQKLEIRIKKIEELIAQNDSEEESDEFVNINDSGLMLFKELHDKLYNYQRDGVAFLYSLFREGRKGGILADDMGLGKTIQVISFLSGMYDNDLAKHTLLIMPTSLITNWTKEFAKWTPGMRVKEFHGISKGERTRNLEKVQRRGGVLITTYTMLMNNWEQLSSYHGREFTWDYTILDEAHKIKNTGTKTAKSVYAIPSKNRVLLTGTPVQNNLREMWALFDFACQGTLLGTAKTFKTEYENPITRAREKDATPGEKALGMRMSETLMATIKPYFLRRTKSEVQANKRNGTNSCKEQHSDNSEVPKVQTDSGAVMPELTRKNDLIVWTYLSSIQEDIYRQFISLDHIKELLLTTRSPLAELNMMKKLCDHPRLLSAAAIAKLGLEENGADSQQSDEADADAHSIDNVPDDTLISESGKLVFLFALLERLREEGHRTLIFAHYRKVLDIIERILGNRGFKVLRLDGTITHIAERERRISLFQKDNSYSVFLLTTQVGGVGITLTAANRVVIYDPSWNPATDAQAVDRAYRIGQTENVVIYRLITCGTVEEKIYRRQVFKDSLIRQNTGDKKNPFRYFSKQELKELFTLEETRSSSTQLQLQELHSRHRRTDHELDEHIAHLHTMEMFGISDHDLMFSLDFHNDEAPEDQEEHHYIEGRVQKAQELMKAESELQMQLAESMASSTEPAWLRQPADSKGSHERKPRMPRQSPAHPQQEHKLNGSVVVVDLDQDSQENPSDRVIDLTADESAAEVLEVIEDEVQPPVKQEISHLEAAEEVMEVTSTEAAAAEDPEASVGEAMDKSVMSEAAGDGSLLQADDEDEQQLNGVTPSNSDSEMDLGHQHISPLQNKSLSVLQASNSSFRGDSSSRVSTGLESLNGNFQLQLDDSDMFSDHDDQDTEAEEQRLLSQLKMEGSFDVNKSLSERQQREASRQSANISLTANMDESVDGSIVVNRKKRAAVIYDSEEEDDNEEQQLMKSQLENSFQALGASTPKSGSTPLRPRRSIGGNTSVASRRSLLQSIIEDVDNQEEEEDEGDDDERSDEAEEEEDDVGSSGDELQEEEMEGETLNSEEEGEDDEDDGGEEDQSEEEEDDVSSSGDELQQEETEGETLNSEEEGEDDEDDGGEEDQSEEMSLNLEESSGEPELASSERMDRCTAETDGMKDVAEAESYDSLVSRGKECFSRAQLDEALGFFLKAIDIQPGDPEVQLMTIQLYRQLSQRRLAENVVIYRLITCGTVEEKIYRRQVFKDSLIRQNTGDKKNPFRYFSKQELKELFTLEETRSSSTQLQLQELHSRHRRTDHELDEHIAHLHTMEMFGISDHDLMFSLDFHNDEAPEDQEKHHYIEGRVQKAQELMKAESELQMQLAESMASSTEPAWLRQPADSKGSHERKPRMPRQSPAHPQQEHKLNGSVVVVDLDQDSQENPSDRVIDLTADESAAEVLEVIEDEVQPPVKQEISHLEAAEEVMEVTSTEAAAAEDPEASVGEAMDKSVMSEAAGDGSLLQADDEDEQQLNGVTPSNSDSEMDLGHQHISSLQNKSLSVLQASNSSFRGDSSSRVSTGFKSINGTFRLWLDESDVFSDHDDQDTEAEEQRLLSQLKMEGSFDVNKSLSERQQREASRQSANISLTATEEQQLMKSQLENSFQALGASTPKSGSTPLRPRRSIGGNTSVASRRSLLQSIIEDVDNQEEEEDEGDDDERSDEAEEEEDDVGSSGDELQEEEMEGETLNSEEEGEDDEDDGGEEDQSEEEEDDVGSSGDELQQEEMDGETLNSEEEGEDDEDDGDEEDQSEEMSLNLEESSGERALLTTS